MGSQLVYYQFSRSKVESGDWSHFLGLYAPDKLPTGLRLREMMNSFVFCIEGWDDDPREIHMVPEIRRFYSTFHKVWPYWLYFCNLDQDGLKMMVFCCMKSFTAFKVDNQEQCAVRIEQAEVHLPRRVAEDAQAHQLLRHPFEVAVRVARAYP